MTTPFPRKVLVEADNVNVSFGGRRVLHDVSLSLPEGEIVTIVGPNGSGKTTLLRSIIGAVTLASGHIRVAPSVRFGYVPQRLHLDAAMPLSVGAFMTLGVRIPRDGVTQALGWVGLDDFRRQEMRHLSGGQFQRVLLAKALIGSPQVLLLDEPTQALDQSATASFFETLDAVRRRRRCSVLMVSHDLHVVMEASNWVVCLNGHVCCEGPPQTLSTAPEYRALFGVGTRGTMALYRHTHDPTHTHE